MLTDQLPYLAALSGTGQVTAQDVKAAWAVAFFSDIGEGCLRRYFGHQLAGISRLLDAINDEKGAADNPYLPTLLELVGHLFEHYGRLLDGQLIAPAAHQARWQERTQALIAGLSAKIQSASLPAQLKECLLTYVQQAGDSGAYKQTFASLHYFEQMASQLNGLFLDTADSERQTYELLFTLGFNHLGYYSYLQQAYQLKAARYSAAEKLAFYRQELRSVNERPEQSQFIYDPAWPSLKNMIHNFLNEEIHFIKRQCPPVTDSFQPPTEKIALNLSVAQLACLLRLLFEEGSFSEANLQDIFRCFAHYFRTKRQGQVSAHSLSKEYYSTSQVTAAVMRDKLLKMVARLNSTFFPG